jgi:hypothetical protein
MWPRHRRHWKAEIGNQNTGEALPVLIVFKALNPKPASEYPQSSTPGEMKQTLPRFGHKRLAVPQMTDVI